MSQYLPTHGFRWLTPMEINNLIIRNLEGEGDDGYIFEVDLKYTTELHRHSCYPLAPERLTIDESMFSPLEMKFPGYKQKPTVKLAPNLKINPTMWCTTEILFGARASINKDSSCA